MTNASARRTPRGRRGLIAGVVAAICGVLAPAALASQPPHPVYVAPPTPVVIVNDGSTLSEPQQLAVNEANHTLLVADQGNARVSVFSSSVNSETGETVMAQEPSVGVGALTSPYGVAVDQASHRLYVSDAGSNQIVRYTFTTGDPATFTPDPSFTSPAVGSGTGQVGSFAASIAVDPTTHDLLVADQGNHRVSRYSASGAFVSSFDGSAGADGVFPGPLSVAVGQDGTVYVGDTASPLFGPGHIERFSPSGAPLGDLSGVELPGSVGVGPILGTLFVGSLDLNSGVGQPALFGFIGDDPTQRLGGFTTEQDETSRAVAVDDGPGGNLYLGASFFGAYPRNVFVFAPDSVLAPGVSLDDSSQVTPSSAHLSGTIDAGDAGETASTSAHFEYYTSNPAQTTVLPDLALPGAGANAVTADLSRLRPNTTYHVQLKADRVDDPKLDPSTGYTLPYARTASRVVSFTTPTTAPAVVEPQIDDVGSTTATISGSVDPFGLHGSYHFEYGPTDSYGSRSPASVDGVIGPVPAAPTIVKAALSGLTPGGTYHYRLVASNSVGTTFGPDRQFTTEPLPTPEATRSYEQITPVDKGGALMEGGRFALQETVSSADGPLVTFTSLGSFPGADVATGAETQYVATRGESDWSNQLLDPPVTTLITEPQRGSSSLSGTFLIQHPADLEHSIVYSDLVLAPGAVEGLANIYREDNSTRTFTFLGSLPEAELQELSFGQVRVFATPDSQHVYVQALDYQLYEIGGGHLTRISLTPEGDPEEYISAPLISPRTFGPISTPNGDAVVYSYPGEGAFLNRGGHVTPISVSARPGDPTTPVPVIGAEFTEDGNAVFFIDTSPEPLTSDGGAGPSLYRYTLNAPAGHHLTYIGGYGGGEFYPVLKMTADGSTVVYDAPEGLMAWRHGERKRLSSIDGIGGYSNEPNPVLSENGRYFAVDRALALASGQNVNAALCGGLFDGLQRNGQCNEVYLFDLDGGTAVCASCAADGTAPAGDAGLGEGSASQAVTNDGEVFFNTKTKLVSADGNAADDVYAYQAGRVHLISRATAGTSSLLQGITSSGDDVFFITDDPLVSQDTDHSPDLYDARIGSGLRGQNSPVSEAAPCGAGECQGSGGAAAGTSGPAWPSESLPAASGVAPAPVRARVSVTKATLGSRLLRFSIHVSAGGALRVSGRYLTGLKRSVATAGTYTVAVPLSRAAQRLHRAHHRLRVGARVSLAPPGGATVVATFTRTLHG
jgi:hypothetical protein